MTKEKKSSKIKKSEQTQTKNEIVLKETEEDIVLSSGFNGSAEELREEVKKESERNDKLFRFIVPFFTFIIVAAVVAGATWYYAKPERENKVNSEEKIQTPPVVDEKVEETKPQETEPVATPASEKKETTYTIKEGDTLSSVANANGLSSQELATYNGITDPNSLKIGQVIKIPVK